MDGNWKQSFKVKGYEKKCENLLREMDSTILRLSKANTDAAQELIAMSRNPQAFLSQSERSKEKEKEEEVEIYSRT